MNIKYPVRVSLTDETLIVDQDNTAIATTFFGKEDYDAEYERRALDAAVIAECLNKRKALNELEESCLVAGEAYQVIGDLALATNLYDHPEVQRALDWFSGFEPGVTYKDDASILPWPREELKADDYAALTTRIKALKEENKGLLAILDAVDTNSVRYSSRGENSVSDKMMDRVRAALNGGCPECGGDCSAANPPIIGCPMLARSALAKKEG